MLPKSLATYMSNLNQYFAELSDLGLPPGEYPASLRVEGEDQPFNFVEAVESDSEDHAYAGLIYKNANGTTVKLFND